MRFQIQGKSTTFCIMDRINHHQAVVTFLYWLNLSDGPHTMCEIWPKDWIDAEDEKNKRKDRRNVFCFPQWNVISKFPSKPNAFPYDIQDRTYSLYAGPSVHCMLYCIIMLNSLWIALNLDLKSLWKSPILFWSHVFIRAKLFISIWLSTILFMEFLPRPQI